MNEKRHTLQVKLTKYSSTAAALFAASGGAQAAIVHDPGFTPMTLTGADSAVVSMDGHVAYRFSLETGTSGGFPVPSSFQMRVANSVTTAPMSFVRDNAAFTSEPAPMQANKVIGPQASLAGNYTWQSTVFGLFTGSFSAYSFADKGNRFLGVRFQDGGGTDLYGWIELNPQTSPRQLEILGWAYEDTGAFIRAGDIGTPPQPAPAPSGLALLALGVPGLALMRRRRKESKAETGVPSAAAG